MPSLEAKIREAVHDWYVNIADNYINVNKKERLVRAVLKVVEAEIEDAEDRATKAELLLVSAKSPLPQTKTATHVEASRPKVTREELHSWFINAECSSFKEWIDMPVKDLTSAGVTVVDKEVGGGD